MWRSINCEAIGPAGAWREVERRPTGTNGGAHRGTAASYAKPRQSKPRRFYGSVEIDMVRPVKSFDAIFNAVVMELQRTQGAKVKLTLEIEAEAPNGFAEGDIGVVRDNARQLKFKPDPRVSNSERAVARKAKRRIAVQAAKIKPYKRDKAA